MPSFLEKLKLTKEEEKKEEVAIAKEEKAEPSILQLDVDIYQNPNEIIIYAQIPGSDVQDLDISLSEENDVLTIEGKIEIPKEIDIEKEGNKLICQECKWGKFYRQIILPKEADLEKVEAKLKKGVLFLKIPFLKPKLPTKKKIEIKAE
jgi:HSP20 family protein